MILFIFLLGYLMIAAFAYTDIHANSEWGKNNPVTLFFTTLIWPVMFTIAALTLKKSNMYARKFEPRPAPKHLDELDKVIYNHMPDLYGDCPSKMSHKKQFRLGKRDAIIKLANKGMTPVIIRRITEISVDQELILTYLPNYKPVMINDHSNMHLFGDFQDVKINQSHHDAGTDRAPEGESTGS